MDSQAVITSEGSAGPGHNRRELPGATLRGWLEHLDAQGDLAIANPGVNLKFGLSAIAARLDGEKAALFPQPGGHDMPVVSGIVSRRSWIAEALGVPVAGLLNAFKAAASNPLPCSLVNGGLCQTKVVADPDLLRDLPIPVHNELDNGPYITAGLIIVRNPKTGIQNVAIVRMQVVGARRIGALLLPRHTMAFMDLAEQAGHDLPCAIVIGASPAELLASQAIAPIDCDELEIAGALMGQPLKVVRCKTSDIHVPAEAEIVLEGRLLAGQRAPEGPFGEFTQYYGASPASHVIEIDLMTHRPKPIYHTIIGGGLEHLMLGCIPREATILESIQRNFPNVSSVALSPGGVCRYHLCVQMKPRADGEAKNVILAAFAAHYDIKQVVVVDIDVDIHDPREVEWAVATRFQASRDLVLVHEAQGSKLDPSTNNGVGSKMGLDATVPIALRDKEFKRISIPGMDTLDVGSALDPAAKLADFI
jgi:2,5-furandicarboxylate decarboxylase 1